MTRRVANVPPPDPELTALLKKRKPGQPTVAYLTKTLTCRMDKEGNYILPATDGERADLRYKVKEERLAVERTAERIKKLETQLNDYFIENLPASQTGVAGRVARVQIETKAVPQVEDWDKFYRYVGENKAYELLQRRLNEGAARERIDGGEAARAGLTVFHAKRVSCVKL